MEVTVALAGGKTETVRIDGGTYGDLLREVGLSPQAAAVLVDGRPVPADAEVDATEVQVLRLISGGSGAADDDRLAVDRAQSGDGEAVIALLDRTMLSIDRQAIRDRIGTDAVLVVREDGAVRGAVVLDGNTVTAIAVDRNRRDRGIGSALIEAAVARHGALRARFDERVRPFYESLGFQITTEGERLLGELPAGPRPR